MKIFFFSFLFFWFCWSWKNSSRWLWCRLDKKNQQNATKNCLTVAQFSFLFNSVKRLTYDELIFVKNREHFDDANLCHVTHVAKMSSVIRPLKESAEKTAKITKSRNAVKPLDKPQSSLDNIGLQVFFFSFSKLRFHWTSRTKGPLHTRVMWKSARL